MNLWEMVMNTNGADGLASFPGFPSSFPSLAVREKHTASDGKLEWKPGNEATDGQAFEEERRLVQWFGHCTYFSLRAFFFFW